MVVQPYSDPVQMALHVITIERLNATMADLAQLPDDDFRYALVRGVLLRMPPPKRLHGIICHRLHRLLDAYCVAHQIPDDQVLENVGYNFTGPDHDETVLAPDISLAQAAVSLAPNAPYEQTPPLLAVEVVSPSETHAFMADKVAIYLRAGVQVVWVIWPDQHTVDVWDTTGMRTLTEVDMLAGGTLLPDFALLVREIFPE